MAALLWEQDGKRGYQFSDGKMRVFKQGFYHLFETAEAPGDGSAKAVRRLARLARADGVTEATRLPTLRDQILLFRRSYPKGFYGDAWMAKCRGVGVRKALKRLKRHRDPAISDAHQLSAAQLAPLVKAGDHAQILDRMIAVAEATNLVPGAHVKKLRKLSPSRELTTAVYEWITCEQDNDDADRRFNHLVRQLGDAGTWPVVTSLRGLLEAGEHVCVRPSVFSKQAKLLLPSFSAESRPRYKSYVRYLHVANVVRDELTEAGFEPRDLLDVHDFMWETLRPAAREDLIAQYELPPPAVAEVAPAVAPVAEQAAA
ncbi:hypothetical protein DB30_06202 [Enhygromyxa salina]|uniref:Uncharacterized protein n=1 Tax=Enhygromyxa salina TaxID=215803 RepID=A0A0C2CZ32_9BACT|nr:hypothetical protein [Enhygromyxa salina]KIG14900.1 hypothetical protein DB30_06202 [Enhygromyxa salina]